MKSSILALTLALLPAGCATPLEDPEPNATTPRELHGDFTGEIKPVLYVRDVRVSAEFFRDALGFELLGFAGAEAAPYYADLGVAGRKFGIHAPTADTDERKVGRQKLYFRVRDAAAHRRRVLAWNVPAGELRETDWMTMFTVVDPDGHEIVFAENDPERHTIDPW